MTGRGPENRAETNAVRLFKFPMPDIGEGVAEGEIVALFGARGAAYHAVCEAADALRREVSGETVSYIVTRNINYTNVCYFKCSFCAFSKGRLSANLRGTPYDLATDEIVRRAHEACHRGAVEVCMQGGIHPEYTGETYLGILRAVKDAVPGLHVHAFSPLEVSQGAATLGDLRCDLDSVAQSLRTGRRRPASAHPILLHGL